jgi:cytosine/uracil/thiamine/allantoin permease
LKADQKPFYRAVVVPIALIGLLIWAVVVTDGGKTPYITGSSTSTLGGGKVWAVFTGIDAM